MKEPDALVGTPDELAVVMPAHQAGCFLRKSLPALRQADPEVPIVVVDDGSTDDTAAVAEACGARVLRLPVRSGPAAARNAGADAVDSRIVLFLDADCVPHADVTQRVREAFRERPDLVALSGSYDADPAERDFWSLYMNLRHHYTHQHAPADTPSFWAGCGAVRRSAFLEAGGFDAGRFRTPAIEDIELAVRLRGRGALRFDRDVQVRHLKRWTPGALVRTEIRQRALPWARLLRERADAPRGLNLRPSQRIAAALAPLALAALPALAWTLATGRPRAALVWVAVLAAALASSYGMVAFFTRTVGPAFAMGALLFHQVHLVYSSAAFLWVLVTARRA